MILQYVKRRDFMTLSGLTVGSCLLDSKVSRMIRETCLNNGQPYLIQPDKFTTEITAVTSGGEFALHIGDPYEDPNPPTWRDYLGDRGAEVDDPRSVEEWCQDELGCSLEESGLEISADEPISDFTYENWLEGEYTLYESSMAQAYHYLGDLKLSDKQSAQGEELGNLSFIEGPFPGSNLTYVSAPDYATLACLQSRLLDLGEMVKVQIIEDY